MTVEDCLKVGLTPTGVSDSGRASLFLARRGVHFRPLTLKSERRTLIPFIIPVSHARGKRPAYVIPQSFAACQPESRSAGFP